MSPLSNLQCFLCEIFLFLNFVMFVVYVTSFKCVMFFVCDISFSEFCDVCGVCRLFQICNFFVCDVSCHILNKHLLSYLIMYSKVRILFLQEGPKYCTRFRPHKIRIPSRIRQLAHKIPNADTYSGPWKTFVQVWGQTHSSDGIQRGVTLTPQPLLVPWSRKSGAIPLLLLWAVRPVQSLSACTRVHFTFTFI